MTKTRKVLLVVGGTLVALGVGSYLYAPTYVKNRIERERPDIKVDSVSIGWKKVTAKGVYITRDWVHGTIDEVTTDWSRTRIEGKGGSLEVSPDKKPTSTNQGVEESHAVVVRDITLHVQRGETHADLTGATYENGGITFIEAKVVHPKFTAKLGKGNLGPKEDVYEGTFADVEVSPSKSIPYVNGLVNIDRLRVTLSKKGFSYVYADQLDTIVLDPQDKPTHIQLVGTKLLIPPAVVMDDGSGYIFTVEKLLVAHPWLNPEAVTFSKLSISVPPKLKFPDSIGVLFADVRVRIQPSTYTFSGDDLCQNWVRTLPPELRHGPLSSPTKYSGNLAWNIALKPKPAVKITSTCKLDCSAPEIQALKKPFTYKVYSASNTLVDRKTGPGTEDWTPIGEITPNLPLAVMEMEDRGFPHHKGFIPAAFENSLDEDLKKGKFARGGSTITMQLAKNLWLRRNKTLGRKVEELLLTMGLESCFTKDQLMELYVNVVEFGPDLYGIKAAAKKYFDATPQELAPDQAFYLASLLPNPKKAPPPDTKTMARMGSLMQMLVSQGRIPDTMLLPVQAADTTDWSAGP